jgi:two-component system cell cycle sensor histidine kinase/response regulator CckA
MLRVLVIDHDSGDYLAARGLLAESRHQRYVVERADTYAAGLDALLRAEHDVYLIASHLDGGAGTDLMREALRQGCRAPVLLLTDSAGIDRAAGDRDDGSPTGWLVKSELTADRLEHAIECAMTLDGNPGETKSPAVILPVCMYCDHVRDERGDWGREETAAEPAEVRRSHGVCPGCWDSVVKVEFKTLGITVPPEYDEV